MALFPMFVDLRGRTVLVIGGGEVAGRKVQALLHAGARVRVHAREWSPLLAGLLAEGKLERIDGAFEPAWIDETWLVVAATDDDALNRRVAGAAGAAHRWVNVVDDATLSSYQVPAVVDRFPLQVAISSAGAAPVLARRLRERLEIELDESLGTLAGLFATHRAAIRARLPDPGLRRRWFDAVLDGPIPTLVRDGELEAAAKALLQALAEADPAREGHVALIGCAGDQPDLLSLRALRLLNQADRLLMAGPSLTAVLSIARRDAHLELHASLDAAQPRLLECARAGERVACLRDGGFEDPAGVALITRLRSEGLACEAISSART